jgi:hypothetical protein
MHILAEQVLDVTGESVLITYLDWGCSGPDPAMDAKQHGVDLCVVRLPEAKGRLCAPAPAAGGQTPFRISKHRPLTERERPLYKLTEQLRFARH